MHHMHKTKRNEELKRELRETRNEVAKLKQMLAQFLKTSKKSMTPHRERNLGN